jgi:hypothetical protein
MIKPLCCGVISFRVKVHEGCPTMALSHFSTRSLALRPSMASASALKVCIYVSSDS